MELVKELLGQTTVQSNIRKWNYHDNSPDYSPTTGGFFQTYQEFTLPYNIQGAQKHEIWFLSSGDAGDYFNSNWDHWKKALIQWFNIKSFSICCSNTISAFFPINVLISPKDIIWTVEWSAIKICSSRRMSFSNRNLLWAVCTPFYQIRQSNNLNLSPNDQYEEQKMFFHPFLELGMSRCTVERGRSKSRQPGMWDIP